MSASLETANRTFIALRRVNPWQASSASNTVDLGLLDSLSRLALTAAPIIPRLHENYGMDVDRARFSSPLETTNHTSTVSSTASSQQPSSASNTVDSGLLNSLSGSTLSNSLPSILKKRHSDRSMQSLDKDFTNRLALQADSYKFRRVSCGKGSSNRSTLKTDSLSHFICEWGECSEVFPNLKEFVTHAYTHQRL